MMDSGVISVLVPVYKAEKYLRCCLDSIINQTYSKLEIILVDDGSPDSSGIICDEYAKWDPRVQVIHCENGGAGRARNIAAKKMHGEFVAYVDSDDFIAPDMYEILMSYMTPCVDLVECGYENTVSDQAVFTARTDTISNTEFSTEAALREHIADHSFRQLIWNKLYRRRVVEHVLFPEGKKIDDEFWMYRVIGNAKNLIHIDARLYAYRQQENSVMHSISAEQRLQAVEARECRHQYIMREWPMLIPESTNSLWMTCIYQGQLAMRYGKKEQTEKTFQYLNAVLKKYPIDLNKAGGQAKWFRMAQRSLKNTCRLRNTLHVGL